MDRGPDMPSTNLRAEVVHDSDGMVVAFAGELDLATGPVARSLFDHVDWSSVGTLTVDLRRVEFMDSTGLDLLLRLRDAARLHSGKLLLIAGPPPVRRVFATTRTESAFSWNDGVDEAPDARVE